MKEGMNQKPFGPVALNGTLPRPSTVLLFTVLPHQFTEILPDFGNCNVKKMNTPEINVPESKAELKI